MASQLDGVVVFTDIEGSVRLWEELGPEFAATLDLHNRTVRECAAGFGGREVKFLGDGFMFTFEDTADAIRCGVELQQRIEKADWPDPPGGIRVRVAVHAGELEAIGGGTDYVGSTVNLASRIIHAGYGGQTLVSRTTADQAVSELSDEVELFEVGLHQLRDVRQPVRLLLATPAGVPAPEFIPIRSLDTLPTNLVVELDEFVGRQRELAEIDRLLSGRRTRLLSIAGPGGVGKTRLLQKVGSERLDDYADGVWMVELADVVDPVMVPSVIASSARMSLPARARDPVAELVHMLEPKSMLLLLDNYERLMDAATIPLEIVRGAPGVDCIVTSRERLRLPGEFVFELRAMPLPDVRGLAEEQLATESLALFGQRAAQARGGVELRPEEIPDAARICHHVGGLPLGIELAAAQLSHMTLRELGRSLDQRLDVLSTDMRGVPKRQQSIRATIHWSCDLLSEESARVLAAACVFQGGFFPEALEAVCQAPDTAQRVQELRDKSLLQADARIGRTRYSMLPLLREYASEMLGDARDDFCERAAHYFGEFVEGLRMRHEIEDVQAAALELDNIRATLAWAEAEGELELLARVAASIWPTFQFVGARGECVRWLEASCAAFEELEDRDSLAWAKIRLAVARKLVGDAEGAIALVEEGLALAREMGVEEARQWAILERANVLIRLGEHEAAKKALESCLAEYRERADEWGIAECLRSLGGLARVQSDYDAAEGYFQEALALEDAEHQTWGVSNTLSELGLLRREMGDTTGALEILRRSVQLSRRVGDKPTLASRLTALAEVAYDADREQEAWEACAEALFLARRHAPDLVGRVTQLMSRG